MATASFAGERSAETSAFCRDRACLSSRLAYCAGAIYLLPLVSFSIPGREAPTGLASDPVTLAKVALLMSTVALGVYHASGRITKAWKRWCFSTYLPLLLFLAWAFLSVAWSPMKSVSLGQCGGLTALTLLSINMAIEARDRLRLSWLLKHLCYCLAGLSALVMLAFAYSPEFSGLIRGTWRESGSGLIHPTAAGATAGLGIMVTLICCFTGRFLWANRAVFPAVLIHALLLFVSHSRSALAITVATTAIAVFYFGNRSVRSAVSLFFAAALIAMMCIDPGLHFLRDSDNSLVAYALRGQDAQQLQSGSGRIEMWQAVWAECQHAIVKGHGYFVTSRTGELYVWQRFANHTAHNVYLQVLASTGLIGIIVWLVAFLRIGSQLFKLTQGDDFSRGLLGLLVIVAIWYLGWTIGCVSFMGPVRAESVVFFALIGIGTGQANQHARKSAEAAARTL